MSWQYYIKRHVDKASFRRPRIQDQRESICQDKKIHEFQTKGKASSGNHTLYLISIIFSALI
jgi:hypothetical protein